MGAYSVPADAPVPEPRGDPPGSTITFQGSAIYSLASKLSQQVKLAIYITQTVAEIIPFVLIIVSSAIDHKPNLKGSKTRL